LKVLWGRGQLFAFFCLFKEMVVFRLEARLNLITTRLMKRELET
jgi:hypothetical protein